MADMAMYPRRLAVANNPVWVLVRFSAACIEGNTIP
ncbi:MAG: hypothetical protein BWY79_02208 [Actinobacteria bacterium ADurb.Bin444]|nr:MAG: hypothetical protein BWY79_02208 [Actinobacteria bacterium ADurb.Bin444]